MCVTDDMTCIHPLQTDIVPPEQFTWPFFYHPHPLSVLAAEKLQAELSSMQLSEGKMFGILVVDSGASDDAAHRNLAFLAAYSGLLEGRNDWPYFVPPVFDAQQPDGHFKRTEREISAMTDSPVRRKVMSQELQMWLFRQYRFLNAEGECRDLLHVWQDYHSSPSIRKRFPLPPGGTGDCCAPKLLQFAYRHGLKPLCMAEFWWGPSPKSEIRHHGQFYPACRGKCKPVLAWMMRGLDVEPNPEEALCPRLVPEMVFEDASMAVLNKPSGMLSVPGRIGDYSVATWAQTRWADAMLVHRLDMFTAGLLVVAKTKEAYLSLQQQFVKRTVRKRYLAILDGVPASERGRIALPLYSDPLNRPRQVVDFEHGKSAVTEYEVLAVTEGKTLVALYPHTGRTHQLRVHCAHADGLGCPILGDELYGRCSNVEKDEETSSLCLFSDRLTLRHPLTSVEMTFELSYPFDKLVPYNNK